MKSTSIHGSKIDISVQRQDIGKQLSVLIEEVYLHIINKNDIRQCRLKGSQEVKVFERIDRKLCKRKGYLEISDVEKLLEVHNLITPHNAKLIQQGLLQAIMRKVDRDGDGKIMFAEFQNLFLANQFDEGEIKERVRKQRKQDLDDSDEEKEQERRELGQGKE